MAQEPVFPRELPPMEAAPVAPAPVQVLTTSVGSFLLTHELGKGAAELAGYFIFQNDERSYYAHFSGLCSIGPPPNSTGGVVHERNPVSRHVAIE
jgi:hypothetical protein